MLLFLSAAQLPAQVQHITDKIKITSYYHIDSEWTFNLFDYANNKAITLFNDRACAGYKILDFDESAQTAVLSTPRGIYFVGLQEHSTIKEEDYDASVQFDELDFSASNGASNRRILNLIK